MALYRITRRCGHDDEVQLYGTNARGQRDMQAEQEAQRLCRPCLDKERATVASEHAARAADLGLPELTGSPKQVVWAETLRAGALTEVDAWKAEVDAWVAEHPDAADEAATLGAAVDAAVRNHTDAKWWIDYRATLLHNLRKEAQGTHDEDSEDAS